MFGLAAVILFVLAAIFQVTGGGVNPHLLAYIGLACLAAHVTFGWPLSFNLTRH